MYEIITHDCAVVEIRITGFWTVGTVDAFARDIDRAARVIAARGERHSLLCHYSDALIQSQDVVAALIRAALRAPIQARHIALYSIGRLGKLQARRIAAVRPGARVFDHRRDALAWLKSVAAPSPGLPDPANAAMTPPCPISPPSSPACPRPSSTSTSREASNPS